MENLLIILFAAIFVNNFVLSKFLGICPFIGVSKRTSPAFGMGIAVTFVMFFASMITWAVYTYVLVPFGAEYLQILVFIIVIASFVQLIEMFLRRNFVSLYNALGIYLPLITTNCAVLGVAFLNIQKGYSLAAASVNSFGAGLGFTLALLLMSAIREKLELADIPRPFRGVPIALITAAMMSMAFMAFAGMIK